MTLVYIITTIYTGTRNASFTMADLSSMKSSGDSRKVRSESYRRGTLGLRRSYGVYTFYAGHFIFEVFSTMK